jgi:anaphase-promoting complex subunit 1
MIEGAEEDWEFLINDQGLIDHYESCFPFLKANKKPKAFNPNTASLRNANASGILYPYLRNILYTLHLIYEESKLYRSLSMYLKTLARVLYMLANELNLNHYVSYYENELPTLLSLKAKLQSPVFSQQQNPPTTNPASNRQNTNLLASLTLSNAPQQQITQPHSTNTLRSKYSPSTQLSYIISQEPPSIHKFILRLIELADVNEGDKDRDMPHITRANIHNPFPFIANVSKRTINLVKIYLLITLANSTNNFNRSINFKNHLNQYLLKINITGYNSVLTGQPTDSFSNLEFNTSVDVFKYIFMLCIDMNIKLIDDLYDYSHLISIPIFEAISFARENPILEWPSYVFDLIGRTDLAILKKSTSASISNGLTLNLKLNGKMPNETDLILNINQNLRKEDEDGMQHINDSDAFKCRFNEDLRLKEVRMCLQTTRPIQIKLTQGPDVSDHDFVEEEEKFLYSVCQRTMSLPIGRGGLTLHTIDPIPTEPVQIPELNLKGKSVTKKTTIDMTHIEVPSNMTYWPLFHNGVAAGLTIHSQSKDLSNAWIKSHLAKNFELTNEQAGFLYGLGLTGHLSNLSMLNVHDALARRHDLTNISILLGLAASKICSMDISVIRLISMHIRALMPPVEIELDIPYNIQIAALLSLGLVYAKSANKHISYVLLKEIGRLPGHEIDKDVHTFDREAYSLSAGLALGLVLLEKGKESLTIMDSMFTDELYHYMVGGHKEKYTDINSWQHGSSASSATMLTRLSSLSNTDGNSYINYTKNFHNSHIREGETINTNVTSPAATIALGLIYFNSCDKSIAEWFSPPDSIFQLDSIRPDFLLVRTLARNLILWKFILPTQKWILNQLPDLLKSSLKSDGNSRKFSKFEEVLKFSKLTINSSLNIKDEAEKQEKRRKLDFNKPTDFDKDEIDSYLLQEFSKTTSESSNLNDLNTRIEAFRHIIAGACFSIALKFAGTCNNDAYHTLVGLVCSIFGLFRGRIFCS